MTVGPLQERRGRGVQEQLRSSHAQRRPVPCLDGVLGYHERWMLVSQDQTCNSFKSLSSTESYSGVRVG